MDEVKDQRGYGIVSRSVMRDKEVSIEAKAIYAYLCSFAGNSGQAFPSVDLICSDLMVSRRRFYVHLNQLVEKGYVEVKHRYQGNRRTSSVYLLKSQNVTVQNVTEQNVTVHSVTEQNVTSNSNSLNSNNMNSNNKKNSNSEGHSKKFVKPTIQEIADYVKEKNYNVNPESFYYFYESKGWMIGKEKMKSWKGAVAHWNFNNRQQAQQSNNHSGVFNENRSREAYDIIVNATR